MSYDPDFKKSRRAKGALGQDPALLDRLPPHAMDMEQGVLGCILIAPNQSLPECIEKLKDDGQEAFYDLRHQTIYGELCAMFEARKAIDIITLHQHLKDLPASAGGGSDAVTGIAYLSQLVDSVPSAANLSYYLDIVKEKYLLRKMIQTCTGVVGRIYDYEGEVEQLLDEVEKEILHVNQARSQSATKAMDGLVDNSITKIEHFFNRQGEISGLSTGFPDLDKMTDGLHGGEMWVIAARPSMGKTSLAMNIAEHIALTLALPVAIFSLEMSAESLVLRSLCSLARVNLRHIRDGFMTRHDFAKLTPIAGRLKRAPWYIDDTAALSILQIRTRARRLHQQHGIKAVVIDYLQLSHGTSKQARENRQQEIAEISGGAKALAKELNLPVIILSQLNREIEKDAKRKPRMSDLRESGAIEQDADLIGFLYKVKEDEEPAVEPESISVNLLIAKQRNGPTGEVDLTFLKKYTRFESADKFSD